MGLYVNRPSRLVIPRWRDFKATSNSGELSKKRNQNSPPFPIASISQQVDNWNKEKSIINAIELVNSAFTIGDKVAAEPAAKFIVSNCQDKSHPILVVCKRVLGIEEANKSKIEIQGAVKFEVIDSKIQTRIQEIRSRLKNNPYNTILWLDYARWYTVIGKRFEAERCIRTAIQLNPNNVFVIRCAVRFFLHVHMYDEGGSDSLSYALQLIRKNPSTKYDPWLMATEISLCAYLEKTSNLMKSGFSMVEAKNFSAFELSELSAALATEELRNGSNKSSKKLFTSSLVDPNENATAQAEWASSHLGELQFNFREANSHEASSYYNLHIENWDEGFESALDWMMDQPFSREPANHASYLASAICDDNKLSVKICDFGLRANPYEFTLLNNKAYSLAVDGKFEEAEKTFSQIDYSSLEDGEKVAYTATKGLIEYSKGNSLGGSVLYNEAEALARKYKDERTAFKVKVYKTRTEFLFKNSTLDEKSAIENLIKDFEKFKHPELRKLISNLQNRIGTQAIKSD